MEKRIKNYNEYVAYAKNEIIPHLTDIIESKAERAPKMYLKQGKQIVESLEKFLAQESDFEGL